MSEKQRLDKLFGLPARHFLYTPDEIHTHSYVTKVMHDHLVSECFYCGHLLAVPIMGSIGGGDATITWNKAGKQMLEEDQQKDE